MTRRGGRRLRRGAGAIVAAGALLVGPAVHAGAGEPEGDDEVAFGATCEVADGPDAQLVRCHVEGVPEGAVVQIVVRPHDPPPGGRPTWAGAVRAAGDELVVTVAITCDVGGDADVEVVAGGRDVDQGHRQVLRLAGQCPSGLSWGQWVQLVALALVTVSLVVVVRNGARLLSAAGSGPRGGGGRRRARHRSPRRRSRRH